MTIKGLKSAFKKANRSVNRAIARYTDFIFPLYMPWGNEGEVASVYMACVKQVKYVDNKGKTRYSEQLRDYATELSWTFYRKRGGKFYEKPQPMREGFSQEAWDNYRQVYQLVGQDYLDLRKLEWAIDAAVDERERLLSELEDAGINPYDDAELWQ